MGAKARRVRNNVIQYFGLGDMERNSELFNIYKMIKELLVHDLTEEKFADMYAQTLTYGLFVARYFDSTPDDFDRQEAGELRPRSNPFLREFFDHITGQRFDTRLSYIVDELCQVFRISDIPSLVEKHLKLFELQDEKDPIIHFYEDFLKEYDPQIRKSMGAYYTPLPVVSYIVRQVDEVLRQDFGLTNGLADTTRMKHELESQSTTVNTQVHRVQILDPAVGTATFLNEIIKHIYRGFEESNQQGRWSDYVTQNLLPRLHGFELMMAPYTIAHLKLGMTLRDQGVSVFNKRIGVYLTNTLEEGVSKQPDLFGWIASAITNESRLAAEIKHDLPVMVVVGNPPYSGESSNKIASLEKKLNSKYLYRDGVRLNEKGKKNWLQDDYVKFISFAEDLIERNGLGVVAMITNNGYIDNPTFRNMRHHLAKTFSKIYILDLHGNAKKNETAPDGKKDGNIFDIMQGVAILLAVKTGSKRSSQLADVFHAEVYGSRSEKFASLALTPKWTKVLLDPEMVFFKPQSSSGLSEYMKFVSLSNLFVVSGNGIITSRDKFVLDNSSKELAKRVNEFTDLSIPDDEIRSKYDLHDNSMWKMHRARQNVSVVGFEENKFKKISYRPFDDKFIYFDTNTVMNLRLPVMNNYLNNSNIGLLVTRMTKSATFRHVFVTDKISEAIFLSAQTGTNAFNFPLYLYSEDGERTPNFNPDILKLFTANISTSCSPEDIFDYVYAALHSPSFRQKYGEFMKIDFPRVPIPRNEQHFVKLAKLGRELRLLHLLEPPAADKLITTYPEDGSNTVEKLDYRDRNVYINSVQYFGNVPEVAWNFYIGGYQPAQKWLKDRKGRTLTSEDIEHYQKIIVALVETGRLMKEIDKVFRV